MELINAVSQLGALAQESRLRVFRLLIPAGPEGLAAGEIAQRIGIPHNTLSSHLAILRQSGLVASRRQGRSIVYSIDGEALRGLLGFLMRDCCQGRPEICAPLLSELDAERLAG